MKLRNNLYKLWSKQQQSKQHKAYTLNI